MKRALLLVLAAASCAIARKKRGTSSIRTTGAVAPLPRADSTKPQVCTGCAVFGHNQNDPSDSCGWQSPCQDEHGTTARDSQGRNASGHGPAAIGNLWLLMRASDFHPTTQIAQTSYT